MTDFGSWCTKATLVPVGAHHAGVIQSVNDGAGVDAVVDTLPAEYAETDSLALIADRLGKAGVAAFLRNKMPTKASARSGDMGEILATSYVYEECGYEVGPSRLIQRDHQEWAMRGDDVLGVKLGPQSELELIKVEAKSRKALGKATVKEARKGLDRNGEMPSPHSLTQFAERLLTSATPELGEAVLDLQLTNGLRPSHVKHLMFLFTSGDPSANVTADLTGYQGPIPQRTITLRVDGHQEFIKDAFQKVISVGP
jgi:hypothetical protein